MIVRTVEEIKAYYEELRETFKRTDSEDDDWVGEPIKEAWLLLDHISALETRIAELGEWRSANEPPPMPQGEPGQYLFSAHMETLAIVQGYYVLPLQQWLDSDAGYGLQVIGWRPLPPAPQPSPDQP